jgi:deoxyribonuclease IV
MTHQKQFFLAGAHMSIAGGFQKAIERGESIQCTTIQIFTKSNQQWGARQIEAHEIEQFKQAAAQSTFIKSITAHASYLINIGSPDITLNQKSVAALKIELERCEQLEIPYLVLHPGAALSSDVDLCIDLIAHNLDTVFQAVPGKTMICLENTAGQGSVVGSTFEQLAAIYKKAHHKKRIGFCFDTCHAFVAGYDFSTPATYTHMWKNFDAIIGLDNLKLMHINDSKKGLGSHIDRHEQIGKGQIGLEAFRMLCNDPRFFEIPKILETPKGEGLQEDLENLLLLKKLISEDTRKILTIAE